MPISDKTAEIQRLITAFEGEASKFHDLHFETLGFMQETDEDRKFAPQNHAIMLWQFYGGLQSNEDREVLFENLKASDLRWGLRGAEFSIFGLIEGESCKLFVRMATRAGSLFDSKEASHIKLSIVNEVLEASKKWQPHAKPIVTVNDNPLAIWLNFLLYHLSLTNPGRERVCKVDLDPFSLSLVALERLAADQSVGKSDRSTHPLAQLHFKVAMSFPGEKRQYVSHVVNALRKPLGKDAVFYDFDYQAQLARPNLDTFLQRIYRNQTELIVVFLCEDYGKKEWCGLEWRAVRDIIKSKADDRVMFVRCDDATIDGVFSIDGYIDSRKTTVSQLAELIEARLLTFRD